MGDSDPGRGRLMPAGSRHRRYCTFAASGPGIRVIELHILGMQIQLLTINMGRRWPPSGSCRSPSATHLRVDRTTTVEQHHGFANRCARNDLIKHKQHLPLLSGVLEGLRAIWR